MHAFRTTIHRKYFIDKKIREKTYPTTISLARDYEKECFKNINPRTFATDIAELKEIYKAPIKYDTKNKGYYYADENFLLNVLEGEHSGIPIETISKTETDITFPKWQQKLLSTFMNEVLPLQKIQEKNKFDYLCAQVTILPSNTEDTEETNNEKLFLQAMQNKIVLSLEIRDPQKVEKKYEFLPLHLICHGKDRFYFGKEIKQERTTESSFCLINLSSVKNSTICYPLQEGYTTAAEQGSPNEMFKLYDKNEKKSYNEIAENISISAQTTGNNDIEVIMIENKKKRIFVFSCYTSLQNKDSILTYNIVGEFSLFA